MIVQKSLVKNSKGVGIKIKKSLLALAPLIAILIIALAGSDIYTNLKSSSLKGKTRSTASEKFL